MPEPVPTDVADLPLTAEQIVARQGVQPVRSLADLETDIWEDDAEVDAFIDEVRRARRADVA